MTDEDPEAVEQYRSLVLFGTSLAQRAPICGSTRRLSQILSLLSATVRVRKGIVGMYPDDLDRAGRRCGKRAASPRQGIKAQSATALADETKISRTAIRSRKIVNALAALAAAFCITAPATAATFKPAFWR